MSELMELDGPRQAPASGGEADSLVVLLHGLGADGNDLFGLVPHLAQVLPGAAFVSPHAPFTCDMAPFGYQWFSVQDRSPSAMLAGVQATAPILDAFIDAEMERHGVSAAQTALIGFSQGTMMSLFVAPRREEAFAGIVGFSGRLIAPELLAEEIKVRPPVVLVHGDADEVVPYESMALAEEGLTAAGIEVETMTRPGLGHGIDPEGMTRAASFLAERFEL